jgi:hypothetical protein
MHAGTHQHRKALRSHAAVVVSVVLIAGLGVVVAQPPAQADGTSVTFSYTGADQAWTVPQA